MKNRSLFLCVLFLFSVGQLFAQVSVKVSTDQDEFLPGEALPVTARVVNRSGQTLKLGQDNNWLKFSIEGRDGYVVLQTGDVPVNQEFTLQSSERATVRVNLAPYFQLPRPGHYSIRATVTIPKWGLEVTSDPKQFDVIQGAKLWQQDFGVPRRPDSTNAEPEMRQYALQEANYLHSQLTLYVQVTERSGKVIRVLPIGRMLSFSQPDPEVDQLSNLHVLYQNGPHTFLYTIINPNGELTERQTYEITTRPRLMRDPDGNFHVVGGARRITYEDVPPPTFTQTSTNASGTPTP